MPQVQEVVLCVRAGGPPAPVVQDGRHTIAVVMAVMALGITTFMVISPFPHEQPQADDALYGKWKASHPVKACPKCKRHVEKNGGCV